MKSIRCLLPLLCVGSGMRVTSMRLKREARSQFQKIQSPKREKELPEPYITVEWSRTEAKCMNKCENDARCISCEFDGDEDFNCQCMYQARKQQKWFPKPTPTDALSVEEPGEEFCWGVKHVRSCENECENNKWCTHYRVYEDAIDGLMCCNIVKPKITWTKPSKAEKPTTPDSAPSEDTRPHAPVKHYQHTGTLTCDRGTDEFASPPDDCKGESMRYGIEGKNELNKFGLRYCFDTDTKISWYVQFYLRKNQTRAGYRRNGLLFKLNPRLSVCDQQAPSWYSCPHVSRKKKGGSNPPNWCDWYRKKSIPLPKSCLDHPVLPAAVCNKMVFSGKQCGCPELSGKSAGGECSVDTEICMSYSGYENQVCKGWGEDSDYDRGHLAASSDVFDDKEVAEVCDKVDGKVANEWLDPYDSGFDKSQWHRGDYSKCAWTASFLMTNVVPQGSLLNQICWRDIENALKEYSEGNMDLFVVVGNSRAGMMRGQKTPLEDGYDSRSRDNVLIPKFMWKAACTTTSPTKCTAWMTANRNLPVPEGCRTPLTLRQLKWLLNELDELQDDWIPGMQGWDSDTLLPDLEVKCENRYRPEYCNVLGGKDWPLTPESQSLKALNETAEPPEELQLTCESGEECSDYCRCCDTEFLEKLQAAKAK